MLITIKRPRVIEIDNSIKFKKNAKGVQEKANGLQDRDTNIESTHLKNQTIEADLLSMPIIRVSNTNNQGHLTTKKETSMKAITKET